MRCNLLFQFEFVKLILIICVFSSRVPGNSAAVTALQEELNCRGIENVCLDEEVIVPGFVFLKVFKGFT